MLFLPWMEILVSTRAFVLGVENVHKMGCGIRLLLHSSCYSKNNTYGKGFSDAISADTRRQDTTLVEMVERS